MQAYHQLKNRFANMAHINHAKMVLNRDMITVMPEEAAQDRTYQLIALSSASHRLLKDRETGKLLDQAEKETADLGERDQANYELMRRKYELSQAIPVHLEEEQAALASKGAQSFPQWREEGDFQSALPHLERVFEINREIAAIKAKYLETETIYDALIDAYDPCSSVSRIKEIFGPLEDFLKQAIPQAIEMTSEMAPPAELEGPFSLDLQESLHRRVSEDLGFDFRRGVMMVVDTHPSCYGSPYDMRFTTRCHPDEYLEGLRAAIHEAGHGIYEQNTDARFHYQPVGQSNGMSIHESQSLFWEKQVANHPAFYHYLSPLLQEIFGYSKNEPALDPENLAALGTQVRPGYIRIEADEMTYPMHIFMRFELEERLVAGTLEVKDIPDAWAAAMEDKLGLTPPNHTLGCLQDIHWPVGHIGYFPSYTLGAVIAAQIARKMREDIDDFESGVSRGDFCIIRQWLTRNIHEQGSLLKPLDLVRHATGADLGPEDFIQHLKTRYLNRY